MRSISLVLLLVCPFLASSQFVAAYHQTNLSFATVGYEFKERFRPELRIAVNVLDEDFSPEAVFLYDILNKEHYELYAGVGGRANIDEGIVIPIGLNIYPFPLKEFGFHIELAPVLNETAILRGSWGIRYRFLRSK